MAIQEISWNQNPSQISNLVDIITSEATNFTFFTSPTRYFREQFLIADFTPDTRRRILGIWLLLSL